MTEPTNLPIPNLDTLSLDERRALQRTCGLLAAYCEELTMREMTHRGVAHLPNGWPSHEVRLNAIYQRLPPQCQWKGPPDATAQV